jgi:hypothetical protein
MGRYTCTPASPCLRSAQDHECISPPSHLRVPKRQPTYHKTDLSKSSTAPQPIRYILALRPLPKQFQLQTGAAVRQCCFSAAHVSRQCARDGLRTCWNSLA